MWLSGIITISNSNDDSASLWKIPHWIFTSAKLSAPAVNSTYLFFHGFLHDRRDFVGYPVHFETVYYRVLPDLFVVNKSHSRYFSSRFALLEDVLIIIEQLSCFFVPLWHSFFLGKHSVAYLRVVNLLLSIRRYFRVIGRYVMGL